VNGPREPLVPGGLQFPLPLTLQESAALIGAYRWAEHNLFGLTGSWVQEVADPEIRLHLDLVSGEHAWHAELWEDRLPVVDGVDADALAASVGSALEAVYASVGPVLASVGAAHRETPTTSLQLAVLYRFLIPRLVATYEHHLGHAVPATDGPTIRILRMVMRDEIEAWQTGERLLQGALHGPEDVSAEAAVQVGLESIVVTAGVAPGLVPWPYRPPDQAA
jgi:hypothetical protein